MVSRMHVPVLTSSQPSPSLLSSYLLFASAWDFLKWICFLCPFTLKTYASLVLLFLFPLAASANLVFKGTTSVLPWLLPPVYNRIFSWSADTGSLKCFISLPDRIMWPQFVCENMWVCFHNMLDICFSVYKHVVSHHVVLTAILGKSAHVC